MPTADNIAITKPTASVAVGDVTDNTVC